MTVRFRTSPGTTSRSDGSRSMWRNRSLAPSGGRSSSRKTGPC